MAVIDADGDEALDSHDRHDRATLPITEKASAHADLVRRLCLHGRSEEYYE